MCEKILFIFNKKVVPLQFLIKKHVYTINNEI